jgi:hypothetical protein
MKTHVQSSQAYSCNICGKEFNRPDNNKRHENYRTPNNLTKGKSKLKSIQTDKISQQPENCENRNDPDLVQALLKKWCVESDFKAPNLPLSLRLKGPGCHYNSIYNNTGTK